MKFSKWKIKYKKNNKITILMNLKILLKFELKYYIFILFLFILQININYSQISAGFSKNNLEDNSILLDVIDYHNWNLIVSTLKNIYTEIPPQLKITIEADLINITTLIVLNDNYLLAACLRILY